MKVINQLNKVFFYLFSCFFIISVSGMPGLNKWNCWWAYISFSWIILNCLLLFRDMKVSTHRRWSHTYFCGRALMSWSQARRNNVFSLQNLSSPRVILRVSSLLVQSCQLWHDSTVQCSLSWLQSLLFSWRTVVTFWQFVSKLHLNYCSSISHSGA